ncbi:MAG: glyoxalase/bleomycin resistance protein/dioxygenase [Solirubrobacterales bacterium]|nr:glyoxalase/bleomycin resistance protein/dioxygenase [Solirubrobacterales bacterium]
MGLGIARMNYIALNARDPQAAAAHAEKFGFSVAHAAEDGTHYLKAHGPDPYSLVYKPSSDGPGMHHVSYLVPDAASLEAAVAHLEGAAVDVARIDAPEWNHAPAARFRSPAGHLIELTTGLALDGPVGHVAATPTSAPAPLAPDHVGLGAKNFEIEEHFAEQTMGMLHSSRILAKDGPQVMSFMRVPGRQLYHQLVVVRSHVDAMHHLQFTLKSVDSFYATRDAMVENGIEIEWGPLRHGPGHNIALYFRDLEGNWIEYSVEEEIILDDASYVPRTWSTADAKVVDEWGSGAPPAEMMGPPPEKAAQYAQLGAALAKMARPTLYACVSQVGPVPRPSPQIDVILDHLAWITELEAQGLVYAAGPFVTPEQSMQGDGLLIIRASSEAEARAIFAQDPIHQGGYREAHVFGWQLHQGRLNDLFVPATQES